MTFAVSLHLSRQRVPFLNLFVLDANAFLCKFSYRCSVPCSVCVASWVSTMPVCGIAKAPGGRWHPPCRLFMNVIPPPSPLLSMFLWAWDDACLPAWQCMPLPSPHLISHCPVCNKVVETPTPIAPSSPFHNPSWGVMGSSIGAQCGIMLEMEFDTQGKGVA